MVRSEVIAEAFVVNVIPQKDNDVIVTLFTENGIKAVYGRGYRKVNSRFHILNNRMLKVKITYTEKNDFIILKDYSLLNYPSDLITNIDIYQKLMQIVNYILKTEELFDTNFYKIFEYCYENITKKNSENMFGLIIAYTYQLLKIHIELRHCVKCQSTQNITAFNYQHLGIICKNCQTVEENINEQQYKYLNDLFNFNLKKIDGQNHQMYIINQLTMILANNYGYQIKIWE